MRHRHTHGGGPQHGDELVGQTGGRAQLQATQIGHGLDRLVGHVEHPGAVHVEGEWMYVLELVLAVLLHVVPQRFAGRFGALHHEGQLEGFHRGESARGVTRQCPDHVGHAITHLLKQLGWRTAKLHRGVTLALHAVVRFLGDLVAPGLDKQRVGIRGGRQKEVHFQRHFLRLCGVRCGYEAGQGQQGSDLHGFVSSSMGLQKMEIGNVKKVQASQRTSHRLRPGNRISSTRRMPSVTRKGTTPL